MLDLVTIGEHQRQQAAVLLANRDTRRAELVGAQRRCRLDDLVEIAESALTRRLADEGEQAANDRAGAQRLEPHAFEVGDVGQRVGEREIERANHHLERTIELVGDARHQLADSRETLAPHQLLAQAQILGEIVDDADKARHAYGRLERRCRCGCGCL